MVLKLSESHKNGAPAPQANHAAPMPAGPIVYRDDGRIDWGNMWDSFCVLALDGGPPHRGDLLHAPTNPDIHSPSYHFAAAEIARGIEEVCGLTAVPAEPGWLKIHCLTQSQAHWLAEAIIQENVQARHDGTRLFVPVGDDFRLKYEIKNVITAVAKTTHYWQDHLALEVKQALVLQEKVATLWHKLRKVVGTH